MKTKLDELREYIPKLNLPPEGQRLVEQILKADPARVTRSTGRNVIGHRASRKMGLTLQAESHGEFGYMRILDNHDGVLGFLDQPIQIKVPRESSNGHATAYIWFPDFFVIRPVEAGFEEFKFEDDLIKLEQEKPWKVKRDENGVWHSPAGEAFAAKYGLYYRIVSSKDFSKELIQNLTFFEDFATTTYPEPGLESRRLILEFVKLHPGVTVTEIFTAQAGFQREHVYWLIAQEHVYADWNKCSIHAPDRFRLFADEETALAIHFVDEAPPLNRTFCEQIQALELGPGTKANWQGKVYVITEFSNIKVCLILEGTSEKVEVKRGHFDQFIKAKQIQLIQPADLTGEEQALQLIAQTPPKDLARANRRAEALKLADQGKLTKYSKRQLSRFKKWYRKAQAQYGVRYGYLGLLPRYKNCGDRRPRFPENVLKFVEQQIEDDFLKVESPNASASWHKMHLDGDPLYPSLPSYRFYRKLIYLHPKFEIYMKRKGKRWAYQHAPRILKAGQANENHGHRPFEIGYVDHTLVDLASVCGMTGAKLGKIWISVLIDGFSRKVLAFVLNYDGPSMATTMLLIRECVSVKNRVPDLLVVDGGKEFESVYWHQLMAHCGSDWKQRPPAFSRFGSIIERLFGTLNTEVIYNLRGNTQIMKRVRQVTKSVLPNNFATWTLPLLHAILEVYFFEVYELGDHPVLPMTRGEAFETGKAVAGERPNRLIKFNRLFYALTMVSTPSGKATIKPRDGVRILYLYYWHDDMGCPEVENTKVDIRYDPYDRGVAFAYIKGSWVLCKSEKYEIFSGMSQKQIEFASIQMQADNRDRARNRFIYGLKLAEFVKTSKGQEAIQIQRLKDLARNQVVKVPVGVGVVHGTNGSAKKSENSATAAKAAPSASELPGPKPQANGTDDEFESFSF